MSEIDIDREAETRPANEIPCNEDASAEAAAHIIRHPTCLNELPPEVRDHVWSLVHFRGDNDDLARHFERLSEREADEYAREVEHTGSVTPHEDTIAACITLKELRVPGHSHLERVMFLASHWLSSVAADVRVFTLSRGGDA